MSGVLVSWVGAFLGAFASNVVPEILSGIPPAVIPGTLMFGAFSGFAEATVLAGGFALGFGLLRRRSSLRLLFALSLVFAAASVSAPYLVPDSIASVRGVQQAFAWTPLLSGFTLSILGSRRGSRAAEFLPSATSLELLRRRVALIEALLLVCPVLSLWPFGLVVLLAETHARILEMLAGLVVMGIAAAALVALVRLLIRFYTSRAPALLVVPKSWWILSAAGAALVLFGSLVALLEQSGAATSALRLLGIGVFGITALLPWLHMAIEARVSATGASPGPNPP
jgi:hypothetical protein